MSDETNITSIMCLFIAHTRVDMRNPLTFSVFTDLFEFREKVHMVSALQALSLAPVVLLLLLLLR